jgi:hypothetical protein
MPERQVIILREREKGRVYCAAPFTLEVLFQKKITENPSKIRKESKVGGHSDRAKFASF